MKKAIFILLIVFVFTSIIGCSSNSEVSKVETPVESAEESVEEAEKTEDKVKEEDIIGKIGDTLALDGITVTVTNVGTNTGKVNQYRPLEQDYILEVELIVENNNKDSKFISDSDFSMYDEEGFEITKALLSDETAISANIPGGKKLKGKLFYDAPEQEGEFELQFLSFLSFNDTPMIWKLPNGKEEQEAVKTEKDFMKTEIERDIVGKLNEQLSLDGINITLTNVGINTGKVNQYRPLKRDYVLEVELIVENTNKESQYIDSNEFCLYDGSGFKLEKALLSNEMAISGEIPGGKKIKGKLFYDVPEQEENFELYFLSSASIDDTYMIWSLPNGK